MIRDINYEGKLKSLCDTALNMQGYIKQLVDRLYTLTDTQINDPDNTTNIILLAALNQWDAHMRSCPDCKERGPRTEIIRPPVEEHKTNNISEAINGNPSDNNPDNKPFRF